jgi:hypothetical protein
LNENKFLVYKNFCQNLIIAVPHYSTPQSTMKSFFSKLNTRQLIIHFIASWFFIYAFDTLFSLYDYSFQYHSSTYLLSITAQQRYNTDIMIITRFGILGLIIAYIISWRISVKRNWFWANAVIVFLVAFFLSGEDYLGWGMFKEIFMVPGKIIFDLNSRGYLITNGIVMLAIGSFLLLIKQVINYIDKGVKREKKAPAARAPKAAKAK